VIKLPSGVFRPYAGVSTAILVFTKTGVGGTDHVWFYDMEADGWSLDDKRQPLLPDEKLGPTPKTVLSDDDHAKNNLPDVLMRWEERDGTERHQPHTAQSFCTKAYPEKLLATFRQHFREEWLPVKAIPYFKDRDPLALPFLPKLLPTQH